MIQELLSKPVDPARRLFPAAADRAAWRAAAASPRTKQLQHDVLLEAEELLNASIPELRATAFMRFVRDGNRFDYEEFYFARRRQLCTLILAEALEYRGRFLDALIDRLWAIITEPFWTLPAHMPVRNFTTAAGEEVRDPLPMEEYEIIDLFSAETAMTVTLVLELFEPELRSLSPNLAARCRQVLYERCVRPFDGGDVPFWWRSGENNWTPWVVSNLLEPIRFLLSGTEPERCLELLRRLCVCADAFLARYPADGVCDEGPGYWMVSPLRLFWILEELCNMAGMEAAAAFSGERIRRMGEFIVDSHLCGDYYAAFSDSPVAQKLQPDAAIYRFGERLGSERLMHFANRGAECAPFGPIVALSNVLATIFWLPPEPYTLPEEESASWYPASEQLFVKAGGVALAAKGGHNGEGHNHNDVGSFLFFLRGEPLLVDIGRTEYTKFTFSEHRYENWQLTSLGHNLPSIDGIGQGAGTEFAAREVKFADDGERIRLELDLAGAYPAAAGLEQLIRVFEFDRRERVLTVSDCWRASRAIKFESRFFTPATVELSDDFRSAQLRRNGVSLRAELRAPETVRLALGSRKLEDRFARQSWGDTIAELVVNGAGTAGEYRIRFEPEK